MTAAGTSPALTRLPGRADALCALEAAVRAGRPRYAALLALPDYELAEKHLGAAHAERLVGELAAGLEGAAAVYRWTAGSVLALLESPRWPSPLDSTSACKPIFRILFPCASKDVRRLVQELDCLAAVGWWEASLRLPRTGPISKGVDRRREPRLEVQEPVEITILTEPEIHFRGWTVNISGRGMRLLLEQPVPLGSAIRVDLSDRVLLGEACYCQPEGDRWVAGLQLEHCLARAAELARLLEGLFLEESSPRTRGAAVSGARRSSSRRSPANPESPEVD